MNNLNEVREKLDEMGKEIIKRMKERSGYKINLKAHPENIEKDEMEKEIFDYYFFFLKNICPEGEDIFTYEETVSQDRIIMELVKERIKLGEMVAYYKLKANPSIKEAKDVRSLLLAKEREREIMEWVKKEAQDIGLPETLIQEYFRWLIEQTIKVQINTVK